jgi:hypothetical protein
MRVNISPWKRGIDLGARSKSFEPRLRRKFAFWDFYWISENFLFQFSSKAGEMLFPGDSSQLERSGIIFGRVERGLSLQSPTLS